MSDESSAFLVRRAAPDDHSALLPVFTAFYREEGFVHALDRIDETLRGVLSRSDTAAFLAVSGAETVGAAAISTSYGLEVGLYAELEDLYVRPAWRRRGIAGALVASAADWAREQGCADIEVVLAEKAQTDATLLSWYRARGFRETGRRIIEKPLE